MPDIPIDQAMNGLGMGDMSSSDFIQGLAASIVDKVGPAKKYGTEKSDEQKQLEKQLKQMEQLTEGLEELTATLKKVQQTADDVKKRKETGASGGFGNLTDSLTRIFNSGSNKSLAPLETTTLQKLSKLADEGVKNNCIGVKDTVMWGKMDVLVREIQMLGQIMQQVKVSRGGRKSNTASDPGGPVAGALNISQSTSLPETPGVQEMGASTAAVLDPQKLHEGDKLFASMQKHAKVYADRLKVSENTILQMLQHLRNINRTDVDTLATVKAGLDYHHKSSKYDQDAVRDTARLLNNEVIHGKQLSENVNQADKFANSLMRSGQYVQYGNTYLSVAQQKLGAISSLLNAVNPSQLLGGPQLEFSIAKAAQQASAYVSQVGQMSYAIGGFIGDITSKANIGTWQDRMLQDFKQATNDAIELGVETQKVRDIMSRGFRRGITTEFRQMAHIGVGLARQIGSNVETTGDELLNWVQRFQLSSIQARFLATNIQQVGRITGVTGDNLLLAVKSAAQLAEHMRSAGNFTQEANRSLIQMSAVAQKLGTERLVNPLIEGMSSRKGFMNMEDRSRSFLIRAAQQGGTGVGALNMGEAMSSPGNRAGMVRGFQSELQRFEQMIAAGVPQAIVNAQIEAQTGLAGIGDLQRAVKTFVEGNETASKKIERLTGELTMNTNATSAERKALEDQIAAVKGAETNDTIQRVIDAMGKSGDVNSGLTGSGQSDAQLRNAIREMAGNAGVSSIKSGAINAENIDDIVKQAMSSGSNLREVVSAIQTSQSTKQAANIAQTDPVSKTMWEVNKLQVEFNKVIENYWIELLSRIPTGVLAGLITAASFATFAASALAFFGTMSSALGALGLLKGGVGAAGLGSGGAAAAGAGGAAGLFGTNQSIFAGGSKLGMGRTVAGPAALLVASRYALGKIGQIDADNREQLAGRLDGIRDIAKKELEKQHKENLSRDPFIAEMQGRRLELDKSGKDLLTASGQWDLQSNNMLVNARRLTETWFGWTGIIDKVQKKTDEQMQANMVKLASKIGADKQVNESTIAAYKNMPGQESAIVRLDLQVKKLGDQYDVANDELASTVAAYNDTFWDTGGKLLKKINELKSNMSTIKEKLAEIAGEKDLIEAGITGAKEHMMIQEGRGQVPKRNMALFESTVSQFIKMKQDQGSSFDPNSAAVKAMNAKVGINFGDLDKKVQVKQDATTKYYSAQDKLTESRGNITGYMNQWKDDKDWTTYMQSLLGDLNKTTYASFDDAISKAAPESIKKAIESYASERGYTMETGKKLSDILIQSQKNAEETGTNLQKLTDAGTKPGSIYTHDIHLEEILKQIVASDVRSRDENSIALVRPGNNEAMMQNRIQSEFSGGDPNGTINRANQHLDDLNNYNRQQTEMMKQELEVLRAILARLTVVNSDSPRGDTSSNSRPAPPAQYYAWSVRGLNQPNYGGVENTVRG